MKKKFPLSYRALQKIKAQEYEWFFSGLPDYYLYMNHLGEVHWMKEEEALRQHEFFIYSESILNRWRRRLKLGRKVNLGKLSQAEQEIRLRIRQFLEKKYLGDVRPETAQQLPAEWKYEISDEELENIPVTIEIGNESVWKKTLVTVGILAAISLGTYFGLEKWNSPETGELLVKGDVQAARVYLDDTDFIGYSNKTILNVPVGVHRITAIKEGYVSIPRFHEVEINADSMRTIEFKFKIASSEIQGFLKVVADQRGSKIYVDKNYYGNLEDSPVLTLDEGQHTISIDKTGYVTVPAEKVVHISAGDTSLLIVQQVPVPRKDRTELGLNPGNAGTIAVTSNVKNARIFINGKDTGQETDYVFTQMPPGNYDIQIQKEGFSVEPQNMDVRLTRNNTEGNAKFQLSRMFEKVKIVTDPPQGPIYVDGKFMGEGKYEGVLKIGTYNLSFGSVSGYITPRPRRIEVRGGFPLSLSERYFPKMKILAAINNRGDLISQECEVYTGYTLKNRAFTTSGEGGPAVEYNDHLKDYVWKLGYAFPYRNPKGNDAIKVSFRLPRDLDYDQKFTVRILAATSHEKYPLSLNTKVDISVKFNNTVLSYYYEPKFIENLNGLEEIQWDVTPYIEPGENSFEISTTEKNNTFYFIKRIEIFN